MPSKIAPSVAKTQEIAQLFNGQSEAGSGEALLRALIRLSTERVL
jgi:hypothetical protein